MTGLRNGAHHVIATPVRLTVRPITVALVTLLVGAALALTIALAAGSGSDHAGATKSVRVVPSAPLPPSSAERHQLPRLNGPGMRP